MSVPGGNSLLLATASLGGGVYEIERSLRFNDDDSPRLSFTPSSSGDLNTWTWSGWVKRSNLTGDVQMLMSAGITSNDTELLYFDSDDTIKYLVVAGGSVFIDFETTAKFVDLSAWYHIVAARDGTTFNVYVNGVSQSFQSSTTAGGDMFFNRHVYNGSNVEHVIGARVDTGYTYEFDGYLADIHFIDGQALGPTDFGEFDDNGVWQPIEYTGTYGTNGFHLDFSDNSTAAALGTDTSGNGNDWTVNSLVPSAAHILYGEDLNDESFDDSATSLTLDTTGYSYSTLNTSPYEVSGQSRIARVIKSSDGSSFTATFTTSASQRFIWTSSNGINWSSPGTEYNTSTTPAVITAAWIAWAGGAGAPTTTVDFNAPEQIDSLLDSPTNGTQTDTGAGGEVSGNYATWNPLIVTTNNTLAQGNLRASHAASTGWTGNSQQPNSSMFVGNIGMSSGKWYWEIAIESANDSSIGIVNRASGHNNYVGYSGNGIAEGWGWRNNGTIYHTSGITNDGGTLGAYAVSGFGILGFALDMDNGRLYVSKNGAYENSGNPAAGTGYCASGMSGTYYFAASQLGSNSKWTGTVNTGQRPFAYTAPSGFKALCTANMTDPAVVDGSTAMDIKLYTGTEATLTVSGYNFSPDFVWRKGRKAVSGSITESPQHLLFDTVRGAGKRLQSSTANREDTGSTTLTAFTSDGFTLGNSTDGNDDPQTYVAWAWDAGSTTVNNTDGDVTSSVRANPTYGFSIVKWNPDSNGQSVGHGLNAVPEFIMGKSLDNDHSWRVYHKDLTSGNNLLLDTNQGETTYNADIDIVSTTVFDGGQGLTGSSLNNNIAYCFTSIPGYSDFGFYISNNSADGPFVYLGFRPRYVLIKCISGAEAWVIYDSERYASNFNGFYLRADNAAEEPTTNTESFSINMLSNGFKVNGQWGGLNDTNTTDKYIYAAFAENPIKFARAR